MRLLSAVSNMPRLIPKTVTAARMTGKEVAHGVSVTKIPVINSADARNTSFCHVRRQNLI